MNERLRWWVLPGAIVVLLRVVTLGDSDHEVPAPAAPIEASEAGGTVAVLEASGRRSPPQTLPLSTATAFVVGVPERHRGQRGEMTLWRRVDGQREARAWLTLRPRVKADGTIPIAGLGAGRYDVALRFDDAVLVAENVAAPGAVALRPSAPLPPR
jgi:hypothetical protein